jgi:Neuraminidase (sialidase)
MFGHLRFRNIFVLLLFSCIFSNPIPAAEPEAPHTLRSVENIIAVDNVCAWPSLALLSDGTIFATIHNRPSHGMMEGDVECYASTDEGKTWEYRGTPSPHEKDAIRMNHAFGVAQDGSLIVLCSGWGGKGFREFTLPVMVSRSSDGGRTWDRNGLVQKGPGVPDLIPFGSIVRVGGNLLAVSLYDGTSSKQYNRAYVFFSEDDGRTWGNPTIIGEPGVFTNPARGNFNETTILASGRDGMIAAARTFTRQAELAFLYSGDRGRTWRIPDDMIGRGLTTLSEHPGHLLRLRDGRILLTYGIRHGDRGIGARISEDEGKTWGEPFIIIAYGGNDGGYPSSVELKDGTIVTAYYSDANRNHSLYHMGVVRWKTPRKRSSQDR